MTTSYSIDVAEYTHRDGATPERTSIALASTPDPVIAAALLRAAADRLDPPRPAHRSAADRFRAGEVLPPVRSRELRVEYPDDGPGLPSYAHDADCNTTHDAGPEPCPPPLPPCPAVHANGRPCVRSAHGDFGHKLAWATSGEALRWDAPDGLPVTVDAPGDRMDVPDARLSAKGAERVRRPGRTVETALDRAAKADGCGPTHTHTGSCAYASGPQSA